MGEECGVVYVHERKTDSIIVLLLSRRKLKNMQILYSSEPLIILPTVTENVHVALKSFSGSRKVYSTLEMEGEVNS